MKPSQIITTAAIAIACVAIYLNHEGDTGKLRQELHSLKLAQDSINKAVTQRDIMYLRQIDSVYVVIGEYAFKRQLNAVQTDSIRVEIHAIEEERIKFLESLIYE